KDDIRDRITREERFKVVNTELSFSEEELQQELQIHPERFSPNVILRGLFQEMILPNIVFIGGGGELAYWLQLKDLFQHYSVPFPVQVLRNSFVIIEKAQHDLIKKLELPITEIFNTELEIINQVLEGEGKKPRLNGEVEGLKKIYDELKLMASAIDPSLQEHVEALRTKAVNKLQELEKKLFRAERKKNEAVQRQIHKIKEQLFPNNNLQERVENIGGYYSQWGSEFIDVLYKNSKGLEQDFTVLYQTD
ncbi:MAG TPA: bacillithiol biosynthesis BshC, partial [Flavisolibacter sp.]|nr:bacillithiol biosynthesis BshC [Flavisolibacter sp.]